MKFHKTKDGKKILLSDLELSHLENIIKCIEKKAIDGLTIRYGGSGNFADDMWYDEDILYGKKAKKEMNYKDYISELERRRSACASLENRRSKLKKEYGKFIIKKFKNRKYSNK